MKKIDISNLNDVELEYIYQEFEIMRVLSEDPHHGVVQMLDEFGDSKTMTMVVEYIPSGNSYKWLMHNLKLSGFPEAAS